MKFCVLAFFLIFISNCKTQKARQVKNFSIFVESSQIELVDAVRELVADYNARVGAPALRLVDERERSNSIIAFQKDLVKTGQKLGVGQWVIVRKVSNKGLIDQTSTVTFFYGMEITFDHDNFASKIAFVNDKKSFQYEHLFHLFSHEVGHGMQLDHSDDKFNVMYESIPEKKIRNIDFTSYFAYVRDFLEIPSDNGFSGPRQDVNVPAGSSPDLVNAPPLSLRGYSACSIPSNSSANSRDH